MCASWLLPRTDSWPAGAVSPSSIFEKVESKASRDVLLASVSLEFLPPGRRKFSNVAIAPAVRARSLAWRTWTVERQEGPKTCRTIRRQVAVLPVPEGPEMRRCGGLACNATCWMVSIWLASRASSENVRGEYASNQLAMNIKHRQGSLTLCLNSFGLECLLLSVATAASEFHEDLWTTVTAMDSIAFAVKAFVCSTEGALVINQFWHESSDLPIGFEPIFRNKSLQLP